MLLSHKARPSVAAMMRAPECGRPPQLKTARTCRSRRRWLGRESDDGKPIGSSPEAASRCNRKRMIASSSVLVVGTMCCAAALYYMAAPPMQLTVESLHVRIKLPDMWIGRVVLPRQRLFWRI